LGSGVGELALGGVQDPGTVLVRPLVGTGLSNARYLARFAAVRLVAAVVARCGVDAALENSA
jgi:hypothetical protein